MVTFNPEKHYLGTLCKRGHDYEGTGKSLRRIKAKTCLLCANFIKRKNYSLNHEEKCARARIYYEQHKEILTARARKCRKIHKDCINIRRKAYHGEQRLYLLDDYVKKQLVRTCGVKRSEITEEMIDLKRDQLKLTRLKKEIRHELTR